MGLDTKTWWGWFLKGCEINFKRVVLQVFTLLGGIKKAKTEFEPSKVKKVLFIRHDKLGDMVISLPIFHNLKKKHPHIRIDLVCGKDNYDIVRTDPHITKAYYYHKKPIRDYRDIQRMRKEKYDCVVDLIFGASVTATILVNLIARRGLKLGVGKLSYTKYFDKTVECERRKYHIIESTGRVLNLFNIDLKDCDMRPKLYFEEKDFTIGREFIDKIRESYTTITGINLSAGRPARTWPMEKYQILVDRLLREYPEKCLVLNYAPADYWKAEEIISRQKERVMPIPRGMNIRQVAGLISFLDFLITPDTSITHLASNFDIPSVVMFSGDDGNFNEWGPYNSKIRAVRSPDFYRIEQIKPESVLDAYKKIVSEEQTSVAKSAQ